MKLGIVGAGFIVEEFLKNLNNRESIQVKGIFSRTYDKTLDFAKKNNIPEVHRTIEDLLNSDIDAVYIASHSNSHFDYSMKAISKGIHVLCEKPVTTNSKELEKVHLGARKRNIIFMEAMRTLYMPSYKKVKKLLKEKYFGEIVSIETSSGRISSRLYRHTPELAGGSLMDLGIYGIYTMIDILGVPKGIKADALKLNTGVDSTVLASFKYENALASMYCSCVSQTRGELRILCERGTITIDELSTGSQIKLLSKDGVIKTIHCEKESTGMIYEILAFENRVDNYKKESSLGVITEAEELSLKVIKVMDKIRDEIGVEFPNEVVEE